MSNRCRNTLLNLTAMAALSVGQTALAYEPGDMIVRAGAALVDPHESSSPIVIDTLGLGATGTRVGVDNDTQFGITFTYMLAQQVGIELLAASPFTHDIYAKGGDTLAETSHLPPTLSINYYFNSPDSDFQPFIGAGVNYTLFFDEKVNSNLNDATLSALVSQATGGALNNAISNSRNTQLDLDDSMGLALHFGFDYALNDNWALNVSYWRINIDTEGHITTTADVAGVGTDLPVKARVNVDIDPSVYMAGISYRF